MFYIFTYSWKNIHILKKKHKKTVTLITSSRKVNWDVGRTRLKKRFFDDILLHLLAFLTMFSV